jgi:AraC-like DNA-binding protein
VAILIRTGDVPAGERYDAWRAVVCDTLGPLDLRMDTDAPLWGEIEAGSLGPLPVGRVRTTTPHSVHRTPGLVRKASPPLYRVVMVVAGSAVVAQDGRQSRIGTGELALYDFTRPYELAYDAAVELAVFSIPHTSLALPADAVAPATALPIDADGGTGALVAPLLARVARDHETYAPASAARLSTVVTDLVTAAVAERVERRGDLPPDTQERALLHRVHGFIERHLGDLELDPQVIAAEHHVSVRQLHRLFETEEMTVAAWIRHRRLERCRADLADATLRGYPVSMIAAKWGLPDPAHFSRLFRRAYGVSPADYRRRHDGPAG